MKATSTTAKSRCALFAALALLHAPNARANDCKPDAEAKAIMTRGVYSFAWENDAFGGDHKDSDRYYTNGLKAAWVSPTLRKRNYDCASQSELFAWVDGFNDLMLLRRISGDDPDAIKRNIVIGLGQSMYTPSGTRRDRPELTRNDRPYAGWLYLSYGLNARIDANTTQASDTLHALELNVGMVGPASHAKQLQSWWHVHVLDIPIFRGWDNQLHNEPGILLAYERKYRRRAWRDENGKFEHDLIWHWGGAAGNVGTYANAGVEFRLGTTVPDDFGTSPIRPGGNSNAPLGDKLSSDKKEKLTTASDRSRIESGVHAYAAFNAKAVARDIFLDGNTFRTSHSVSKRPFVADAAIGVVFRYKAIALHVSHVVRSREFNLQAGRQKFASGILSCEF